MALKSLNLLAKFKAKSPPRAPPISAILEASKFEYWALFITVSEMASKEILSRCSGVP
jgi:hypothetical protein